MAENSEFMIKLPKGADDETMKRLAMRVYRRSRSEKTAFDYARNVRIFFRWLGMKPIEAKNARVDWEGKINEYIDYLTVERNAASMTIRGYIASIKKWFEVNEIAVDWKKVELPKGWKVEKDRLLKKEELKEILNGAPLSTKTMVLILLSSGLRVGTLTKLKLKDIKMEYDPPMIVVKPEISKTREGYATFMSPEARDALKLYLRERELNGEKITPESYVIAKERPQGAPLSVKGAMKQWLKLLKKANKGTKERKWYDVHLHSLRKFFKSWMSLSGINEAVVEAFMGHRKGISQTYFIPAMEAVSNPEIVRRLQEEYKKGLPALTVFSDQEKIKELESRVQEQAKAFEEQRRQFEERERAFKEREQFWISELERVQQELMEMKKLIREKKMSYEN